MASGTITLTKSGNGKLEGQIVWSSSSNGTEANTSTVTASIQIKRPDAYTTTGTWKGSLKVGGATKTISYYGSISSSLVTIATLTATVNHNTDGSGTCYIYGKLSGPTGTSMEGTYVSGTQTVTLDTIPRQATLTSATAFNDEENPAIIYTNPLGAAVPSLQAGISLSQSSSDVIAYHDVDKTAGADTIDLTDAERNTLRAAVTDGNTRTVWIYLRTRIGETYYYSPISKTLSIKNPNPTISPTITDSNSTTVALTGNSSNLVKYYSNAAITIGASAVKQATLASQKVTCGSKTLTGNGTINAVESNKFVFTATDSRGNTTTLEVTPAIVEYVKLSCNLANNMPDAAGNMAVMVTGNYFNGSFGAKSNSLSVYYRYKTVGGSYSEWAAMTATKSGNTYSATVNITGLDYKTAYVFQAYAKDELATAYSAEKTVKATPIFDWGESDFKFNVPVYDDHGTVVGNGLATYSGSGSSAIDPDTTLEHLILTNLNTPTTAFYFIHTFFYNAKTDAANKAQVAFPYNSSSGGIYYRYKTSGTWCSWVRVAMANELPNYLPLTGGTLSGALTGTNSYFENASAFARLGLVGTILCGYDTHANAKAGGSDGRQFWLGQSGGTDSFAISSSLAGGMTFSTVAGLRLQAYSANGKYLGLTADRLRPSANDAYYLGDSNYRWKAVYAVNGTIQTSDRNQKENIQPIEQKYIDLFNKLQPVTFEFADKESDRVHIGFISQDVKAAMDEVGLTDLDFAGFCRDVLTEWDEETQTDREVLDEDGNPVYMYSLRYSEFIALNSKMIQLNRQKIAEQEKEIQALRDELESLKATVTKLVEREQEV